MGRSCSVWLFNVFGVRPALWFGYLTGALLILPAFVLMFVPYITGKWSSDNMQWNIAPEVGSAWRSPGCTAWAGPRTDSRPWLRSRPSAARRDGHAEVLRASAAFFFVLEALRPLGLG